MTATVSVQGSASAEFAPEVATLRVTWSSAEHQDRAAAIGELDRITPLLADLAARPAVAVKGNRVSVYRPWRRADDDRSEPQWVASVHALVEVTVTGERDVLADVLETLSGHDALSVHGPNWSLTRETHRAHRRTVTVQAVEEARLQAAAYAEAVGAELGELVNIGDPGVGRGGFDRASAPMMAASARGAVKQTTLADLDLTPQPVWVHAACEVVWKLSSTGQ